MQRKPRNRREMLIERAIYWQQYSAVEYASAKRALDRNWLFEATDHQDVAAEMSMLARSYLDEAEDTT